MCAVLGVCVYFGTSVVKGCEGFLCFFGVWALPATARIVYNSISLSPSICNLLKQTK